MLDLPAFGEVILAFAQRSHDAGHAWQVDRGVKLGADGKAQRSGGDRRRHFFGRYLSVDQAAGAALRLTGNDPMFAGFGAGSKVAHLLDPVATGRRKHQQ